MASIRVKIAIVILLTLTLLGGVSLLDIRALATEQQEAKNQSRPASKDADVQKVLDKYRSFRPDDKDLAIFQLDWMPTLKDAKEKAAKEQRPLFLIVVTNSFGNMYTGHC